jgi:hypothetical protein
MQHRLPSRQEDQHAAADVRPRALARWRRVSTLWARCGRGARTVRLRPAALQLGARCRVRGPAGGPGHGGDPGARRGEPLAPPRMVPGGRRVAGAADRASTGCSG